MNSRPFPGSFTKRLRCSLGRGRGRDGGPPTATRRREVREGAVGVLAHKLPWGDPRPSSRSLKDPQAALLRPLWCKLALVVSCAWLVAGCGESEGVADGATVTAYVIAPLCAEAERELARDGGEAGDVRVRVSCLPSAESSRKLNLTQIGANARQATEDSSAIAYIGEPTRAASRFSEPILEAAGIPQLPQSSGAKAMAEVLGALSQSTDGSLRQSVNDELN
jgi:hypothetical protein